MSSYSCAKSHQSAEQDYLELDYLLNRAADSDRFRQYFGINDPYGNVSITSYSRCNTSICDYPDHFIHAAMFDDIFTYTKSPKVMTTVSMSRIENRMALNNYGIPLGRVRA
jgi:hypothetical protein